MKQRRDITLGEMQDECIRRSNDGKTCAGCDYSFVCPVALGKEMCPKLWFLIDPPRFNEAQMALLKALRGLGFISIENIGGGFKTTSEDGKTGLFMALLGIEYGETLDFAELLGKDGAEC